MTKRTKQLLACLVGVVLAICAYRTLFAPHGFTTALEPVDAKRAVVCLRANAEYGRAPRGWIGLRDAKGSWQWSARLHGLPIVGPRNGLLVDAGIAIVRTEEGEAAWTTAYDVETGKELWRTQTDGSYTMATIDLVTDGPWLLQGNQRNGPATLLAIERANGKVAWSFPLDAFTDSLTVSGSSILLTGVTSSPMVRPAQNAPPGVLESRGVVCFERDELVFVEGRRVLALRSPGEPRVVVDVLDIPDANVRSIGCGRRGGHLIFTLSLMLEKSSDVGLLEIDPAAGRQVRFTQLALGIGDYGLLDQRAASFAFPQSAALNGALPRFVPMQVPAREHEEQFVILDLDELRIVKRGPSAPYRFGTLYKDGEDFFVQAERTVVARIDGRTGQLAAAVRFPRLTQLKPFHIHDGRVWVYTDDWLDSLPLAILDAATLRPIAGDADLHGEDALTATKAAWLGE